MNIIWIDGGLGNQMFQYALVLKQQSLGRQVKIDITKYEEHHAHNDFELDRVFGLSCPYASLQEIGRLGYRKMNHWTEFIKKTPFVKKTFYNNESYVFDPKALTLDGYYLEGFWQSERYFRDIEGTVREAYRFPDFTTDAQREYAGQIGGSLAVSVHIRRGDYLRYPMFRDICTLDYYKNAMQFMRERYRDAVFFIFTNDVPWAREHFQDEDCRFVEGNTGTDSFRDMQLMSLCRHHIIANSSFSWWGAWLDGHPEKTVIAPKRWANCAEDEKSDIVPEGWIRMDGSHTDSRRVSG